MKSKLSQLEDGKADTFHAVSFSQRGNITRNKKIEEDVYLAYHLSLASFQNQPSKLFTIDFSNLVCLQLSTGCSAKLCKNSPILGQQLKH